MTKTNEIMASDYRSYLIDIDFELYFQQEKNCFNYVNFEILNPSRRTHKDQFREVLDEIMEKLNFK